MVAEIVLRWDHRRTVGVGGACRGLPVEFLGRIDPQHFRPVQPHDQAIIEPQPQPQGAQSGELCLVGNLEGNTHKSGSGEIPHLFEEVGPDELVIDVIGRTRVADAQDAGPPLQEILWLIDPPPTVAERRATIFLRGHQHFARAALLEEYRVLRDADQLRRHEEILVARRAVERVYGEEVAALPHGAGELGDIKNFRLQHLGGRVDGGRLRLPSQSLRRGGIGARDFDAVDPRDEAVVVAHPQLQLLHRQDRAGLQLKRDAHEQRSVLLVHLEGDIMPDVLVERQLPAGIKPDSDLAERPLRDVGRTVDTTPGVTEQVPTVLDRRDKVVTGGRSAKQRRLELARGGEVIQAGQEPKNDGGERSHGSQCASRYPKIQAL